MLLKNIYNFQKVKMSGMNNKLNDWICLNVGGVRLVDLVNLIDLTFFYSIFVMKHKIPI